MNKKECQEHISSLNNLLLEQKDQINGLGAERDYWKGLATELLKLAGFEVPETKGPIFRDDDGILIGFESIKEDFLKLKNRLKE